VNTDRLRLAYPEVYTECVTINEESSRVFSAKKKKKKHKKE